MTRLPRPKPTRACPRRPGSRSIRRCSTASTCRVIGWLNFLGDPSQPHHMKMTDIDEGFGVSEATGAAKSKAIRDLIKMYPFDPQWTIPSLMDQNPMAWMIEVNGLTVDARRLPREIQEEAFRKGLIPYIPADRADGSAEE